MGVLLEVEIFNCLSENLRLAAESADALAVRDRIGPDYRRLRDRLLLVEGACRQAAAWREDTRWLMIGLYVAECHKRAGNWLRGNKDETGRRIKTDIVQRNHLFDTLAKTLRQFISIADHYRTDKTGVSGLILPHTPAPRLLPTRPLVTQ